MARSRPLPGPAGSRGQTSPATLAAARAVLAAAGWAEEDVRLRASGVRPDELLVAPVVGGVDTMPGTGFAEWRNQEHKAAWFAAARALRQVMTDAGWTDHGATRHGTYYQRPAAAITDSADAADLAAAPADAPLRLLAIAAELGVREGQLDAAVTEAAHDAAADAYNCGTFTERDEIAHQWLHGEANVTASKINHQGLESQLVYLFGSPAISERAARAALSTFRSPGSLAARLAAHGAIALWEQVAVPTTPASCPTTDPDPSWPPRS